MRDKTFDKIMQNLYAKIVVEIIPESNDRNDFTIIFNDRSEIYIDILQAKINNPPRENKR